MTLEPLPEAHLRVLVDGLPISERYGLLLAGGYALRAHQAIQRPSQDVDLATADPARLEVIAEEIATTYRALGYRVTLIEAAPRSARLLLALAESGGELELDLLKEALGPDRVIVVLPGGGRLPVLPFHDAVGLKVRALHDRFVVRDIIDLHAAAVVGGWRRHEPEFDPEVVADHLAGVPVFEDEDFAAYGLGTERIAAVRAFAFRWCGDLTRRLGEQRALGEY